MIARLSGTLLALSLLAVIASHGHAETTDIVPTGELRELAPSTPGYHFSHVQIVEFPRRYRELAPAEVLKATRDNRRMDVRFKDKVKAPVKKEGFLCPRVGFQIYPIGARFETETGITVAAPQLHYTPWLDLYTARAGAAEPGQEVIVEGFVYGKLDGSWTVISDRILTPAEKCSRITYMLTCKWPGAATAPAEVFTQPGRYQLPIPGSAESVSIDIEEMPLDRSRDLTKAIRFGRDTANPPRSHYQQIEVQGLRKMAAGADVRFTDRMQAIAVPQGEDASVTTSAGTSIPIEVYFRTDAGVRCLIPLSDAILIERASRYYPGYQIEIHGTVVHADDSDPYILVDDFTLAGITGPVESCAAWVVTISHADEPSHVFATPGTYTLDVPLGDDTSEPLVFQMGQQRTLDDQSDPK